MEWDRGTGTPSGRSKFFIRVPVILNENKHPIPSLKKNLQKPRMVDLVVVQLLNPNRLLRDDAMGFPNRGVFSVRLGPRRVPVRPPSRLASRLVPR